MLRGAWLLTAGAAVAGCFSPQPQVGLDCTTDNRCPSGQVCDLSLHECVPDSALDTWRDDTAADFGDPTAILDGATVEANGAVGPTPYFVEGVTLHGIDQIAISPGEEQTISWDTLASLPRAGRGFTRELDLDSGGSTPPGSGLPNGTNFTMLVEGEIYLDAGSAEFELFVNDHGLFELGDPITGVFTRVAAGDDTGANVGVATIATTGWYPFRGAYSSDQGSAIYELQVGTDGQNPTSVPSSRLRTSVAGLDGLALDGFDDSWLLGPLGTTLARAPMNDLDYASPPPDLGDLGVTWSARWTGQILVTEPGGYAFDLDSRGGHRMWLDGEMIADDFGSSPRHSVTAPRELEAGWHDVVLDLMKSGSTDGYLRLTVDSGPELVGTFFPVERMRPTHVRGARWSYAGNGTDVAIPDMGAASRSVTPPLPAGAAPSIADVSYAFTHPVQSSVGVSLTLPGGATTSVNPVGSLTGTGSYSNHVRYDGVGAGSWRLDATDSLADMMTGAIDHLAVAITYGGGTPPFPTRAVYTSRIRELGPAVAISGVRWQTRQARTDGDVQVRLRSCDDPTACAAEPWSQVARSGDVGSVTARRYLQYQIEIACDGDVPTALDWIEIDYRLPE